MAMDMHDHTHRRDHGHAPAGARTADAAHGGGHQTHGHAGHDHGAMIADFRRRFWVSAALTVPILLLSPMIQHWLGLDDALALPRSDYVLFALSSIVFFYGGWPFLKGMASELAERRPGMMTLIALAITVAYVFSSAVVFGVPGEAFFWELATLIDVMLLGHWIEMRSVLGASGALEALVRLLPAETHRVKDDGTTEDIPVSHVQRADRLLVKPGEKVPIDGVIIEGRSSFNEAMLTGESKPVRRGPGEEVIGGSVNGEGAITIRVEKTGDQTYLAQVIDLVRQTQETRSRTQDLANRAALWLTYIALSVPVRLAAARRHVRLRGRTRRYGYGYQLPACLGIGRAAGRSGQHEPYGTKRPPNPRPCRGRRRNPPGNARTCSRGSTRSRTASSSSSAGGTASIC